jgi:hypothetical protein
VCKVSSSISYIVVVKGRVVRIVRLVEEFSSSKFSSSEFSSGEFFYKLP